MPSFEEVAQELAGEDDSERGLERLPADRQRSVVAECQRIRVRLERNHVFYDNAEVKGLVQEVLDSTSRASTLLQQGFHRFVVLDAEEGQQGTTFDLERFLRHIQTRMAKEFCLELPADIYHAENVVQVLRDEPRSLFCFVNVQLIPIRELRRLRGFTQEKHQALFLCVGTRDLARESARERIDEDDFSDSSECEVFLGDYEPDWMQAHDRRTMYALLSNELLLAFSAARVAVVDITGARATVHAVESSFESNLASKDAMRAVLRQCVEKRQGQIVTIRDETERSTLVVPVMTVGVSLVLYVESPARKRKYSRVDLEQLVETAKQVQSKLWQMDGRQ